MQKIDCDYKIKSINSDFRVVEVPLLPVPRADNPNNFTYLWVQKSNFTTFDMLDHFKDFFKLDFSDVAAEGLKDEDGITEQIISVKGKLTNSDISRFNKKFYTTPDTYFRILRIHGYGAEPVHERNLHGNVFQIVVRNINLEAATKILDYVSRNRFFDCVNYYDNQRFGLPGGPYTTHLMGKAICKNNWDEAYEYLADSNNTVPGGHTGKAAFQALNPKKVAFFVSAHNSALWNIAASNTIKQYCSSAQKFQFEHVGNLYLPLSGNNSPIPSICRAEGFSFNPETYTVEPKTKSRTLLVPSAIYASNLVDDELNHNKKCITLSFFLQTGCYATMMIKQIVNQSLTSND